MAETESTQAADVSTQFDIRETDTEPEGISEDVTAFQHYELAEASDIFLGESCGVEAVAQGVQYVLAMTVESEPNPLVQQMQGEDVDEDELETVYEGRMFISNEDAEVGLAISVTDNEEGEPVTVEEVVERFQEDDLRR